MDKNTHKSSISMDYEEHYPDICQSAIQLIKQNKFRICLHIKKVSQYHEPDKSLFCFPERVKVCLPVD
jgi:hypothetical protein